MNWDDLRVARAVYQTGSYAAAARLLKINETTVPRRLARLEKDLGLTLFEAVDGVRRPTAQCEEIVALSQSMASDADRVAGIARKDLGTLERRRIAATDSITTAVLAPGMKSLLDEHPSLAIEFLVSTENVDFSRWEADLAIRLKRPEKGDFIMSKVADFALYFVEPAVPEADAVICAYTQELDEQPESRYLSSRGLLQRARCRTKNLIVLQRLILTGRFCGVLPDYMCADLQSSKSLRLTRLPRRRGAWLLLQRHLRDDPLTRNISDWIRHCLASIPQ